jgi:hypothetical protein
MRSRVLLYTVVVWLAAGLGAAHAKGKTDAKEAFKRALQHYNLGDFKDALDGFKEAYLDYPDPSFLFNIGQCQRQLGLKQEALLSYRAYLREAGEPRNRDEVQNLIHTLEQSIKDEELARHGKPEGAMIPGDTGAPAEKPANATTTTTTAPGATLTASETPPPQREPVYKKWWLWTAVGVVAVGVGVGLGVGLSSSSTHYPSATPSDGTIRF